MAIEKKLNEEDHLLLASKVKLLGELRSQYGQHHLALEELKAQHAQQISAAEQEGLRIKADLTALHVELGKLSESLMTAYDVPKTGPFWTLDPFNGLFSGPEPEHAPKTSKVRKKKSSP